MISAWLDLSNLLAARLVDKLRLESLRGPVIAVHSQHFPDYAPAWLTLDMNDVIDCLSDLSFDVLEGGLGVAAQYKVRKAAKRLCG